MLRLPPSVPIQRGQASAASGEQRIQDRMFVAFQNYGPQEMPTLAYDLPCLLTATARGGTGGDSLGAALGVNGGGGGGGGAFVYRLPIRPVAGSVMRLRCELTYLYVTWRDVHLGERTLCLRNGADGETIFSSVPLGGRGGDSGLGASGGSGGTNTTANTYGMLDHPKDSIYYSGSGDGGTSTYIPSTPVYTHRATGWRRPGEASTVAGTEGGTWGGANAWNLTNLLAGGRGGPSVFGLGGFITPDPTKEYVIPAYGAGGMGGLSYAEANIGQRGGAPAILLEYLI